MLDFATVRSTSSNTAKQPDLGQVPDDVMVILLVEDEPVVRRLLATSLRRSGYCVVETRNGAEGLEAAARLPRVDLVVSDIDMPVMTGPELAGRLRQTQPELRFLFVSGYLMNDHLESTADVMHKPFKQDQLIRKIVELIGGPGAPQSVAS